MNASLHISKQIVSSISKGASRTSNYYFEFVPKDLWKTKRVIDRIERDESPSFKINGMEVKSMNVYEFRDRPGKSIYFTEGDKGNKNLGVVGSSQVLRTLSIERVLYKVIYDK